MGCSFETAKQRIHCNYNNDHKNNKKSNSGNRTIQDNNTTNQHLISLSSTKASETGDCDGSITSKNKDTKKDNSEHQQFPNKTPTHTNKTANKKQSCAQAGKEESTEKTPAATAAAAAVVKNKQKIVRERLKLRQQQEETYEIKAATAAATTEENEFEGGEEEQAQILRSSTLKSKQIDTQNFKSIATYCLFPHSERQTNNCLEHSENNKNNTHSNHNLSKNNDNCRCHSSNGSNCLPALHSQKPHNKPHNDATKDAKAAPNAAANMPTALAIACRSGQHLPEMLLHARDHLTAYLVIASTCFMENLTNYVSAARRKQNAYPQKIQKRLQQQRQQRQQQHAHQKPKQLRRLKSEVYHLKRGKTIQRRVNDVGYNASARHSLVSHSNAHSDHSCNVESHHNHSHQDNLSNAISFYAASSVILVLCFLTRTSTVAAANANNAPFDKHPIHGIDWSKFDESSSDKEILDLLLEKKRYDKRLLPPVNGTLTVNVNVLLLSLASPDESSLKYEVEFLLNQQWNDPRLQYGNKSEYEFLNALHHHDNIWTPDTYFIMHGDFKDPIIPMHFALRIYRNGTILYAMRRHLILSCQGSLHIFPFDDPKCSFSMESISYEEPQIKYVWKNDEDTLRKSPSLTTLNAYLIKNQTTPCDQNSWRGNYSCLRVDLIFTRDRAFYFTTVFIPGIILVTSSFITFWLEWNAVPARSMIGNYSCLQVELTFTRDRAYYFTTVFIPGIILVTSSFITFWLEWNAVPARVMIGVTTMLNFFTTSNGFRSTLPVVSNLTAMNVWDGVCMCFIYASLLEFVCVNYVGRKRPLHNVVYRPGENPVTQRLPAVLSRIGVILASPLEIIEREFHAALSSEKAAAAAAGPSSMSTPSHGSRHAQRPRPTSAASSYTASADHGSIIGTAVQHLRARSVKYRRGQAKDVAEPLYTEPVYKPPATSSETQPTTLPGTVMAIPIQPDDCDNDFARGPQMRHSRSMSTNTPPLILRDLKSRPLDPLLLVNGTSAGAAATQKVGNIDDGAERQIPIKPPRKKTSRSTSPAGVFFIEIPQEGGGGGGRRRAENAASGEKRREASAPNEIVACTSCGGGNSPCTHSANNGCATEACFVQVRKKEPPHPIRVAKTIDVIARITFPTAYSIFLIFFFVHYKGFS